MKSTVFWNVTPCSVAQKYHYFGGMLPKSHSHVSDVSKDNVISGYYAKETYEGVEV
jgi:hypothetical protein